MQKDYLTTSEFAERVGSTEGAIYQRVRNGQLNNCKKERHGAKVQHLIPLTELETYQRLVKTKKPAKPMLIEIPEDNFKDVPISNVLNFKVERGKIPYRNLSTAIQWAMEHRTWDAIEIETGVNKKTCIGLIDELKKAETAQPGKYKMVMDYLYAGRPYGAWNKKMPGKGERNGH